MSKERITKNQIYILTLLRKIEKDIDNISKDKKNKELLDFYNKQKFNFVLEILGLDMRGDSVRVHIQKEFRLKKKEERFRKWNNTQIKKYYRTLRTMEEKNLIKITREKKYFKNVSLTKKGLSAISN
jgi:hypothetical protein